MTHARTSIRNWYVHLGNISEDLLKTNSIKRQLLLSPFSSSNTPPFYTKQHVWYMKVHRPLFPFLVFNLAHLCSWCFLKGSTSLTKSSANNGFHRGSARHGGIDAFGEMRESLFCTSGFYRVTSVGLSAMKSGAHGLETLLEKVPLYDRFQISFFSFWERV